MTLLMYQQFKGRFAAEKKSGCLWKMCSRIQIAALAARDSNLGISYYRIFPHFEVGHNFIQRLIKGLIGFMAWKSWGAGPKTRAGLRVFAHSLFKVCHWTREFLGGESKRTFM